MAKHSLFPNSITINYTSNGHAHKQVLPTGVVAGSAPGWTVPTRSSGASDWRDSVEQYGELLAALLDDGASVDSAELYTYEATDGPAELLAVHPLDIAGTNAQPPQPWTQAVFPVKALGGTSARLTVLEGVMAPDLKQSFASITDGDLCAYLEFILGADDFIKTRGGDFPVISLGMTTKINDKLRKKFLLNS